MFIQVAYSHLRKKKKIYSTYILFKFLTIFGKMTGDKVSNLQNVQLESKNRQFTYSDIQMITNNFEKLLGEGEFGKVYLGYVDGNPVAVKMISQSAVEGYQQFHSEAGN